jgi:hypothetical protein
MRFASVAMRGDIPRNCGHLRFFLSKSRRICAGLLPSPVAVVKEYGEKTITDTDCAQRVLHSCHRAGRNDSLIAKNQESDFPGVNQVLENSVYNLGISSGNGESKEQVDYGGRADDHGVASHSS